MAADVNSSSADQRVKRLKIFQPATLVADNLPRRIHLLDVSTSGFLAHAQDGVETGAQVRVECLGVVRNAVVRWSNGSKFGMLLDRPLRAHQVATLTGSASHAF